VSSFSQCSPIAIHFGALETRLLQLQRARKGWVVRTAKTFAARGKNRHWQVSEALKQDLRKLRVRGKDVAIGMSGEEVAVSLVPVEENNRGRLQEILMEAATNAVEDEEGVIYRYLPLSSTVNVGRASEEFLLLTAGASELRRATDAVKGMSLRPVSLEVSAFAIARAMININPAADAPWSFLHMGFGHSLFGVIHHGEVRFLKPLQVNGKRLLNTLQRTLERAEGDGDMETTADQGNAMLMDILAGDGHESDESAEQTQEQAASQQADGEFSQALGGGSSTEVNEGTVAMLNNRAVGHAVEVLHALRLESESLAQEVRACMRHFANRNKGAKVERVILGGFGTTLPEVENAVSKALTIETELATPFSTLGIRAPQEILKEEHMWTVALGLAMRGYE
jgi:Tfp pilus assembly PilM family ATPase